MKRLTTHVLDTATGKPGKNIKIELFSLQGERRLVKTLLTNDDGRTDEPLLEGDAFSHGDARSTSRPTYRAYCLDNHCRDHGRHVAGHAMDLPALPRPRRLLGVAMARIICDNLTIEIPVASIGARSLRSTAISIKCMRAPASQSIFFVE